MSRTAQHATLIFAVACFAFFTNLGSTHLWDEDEGFFAGCAAEMYARHDVVVPYFNGHVFSHKPPFMYWMMMLGFEAFGVTPFAARLGSAVFGLATALLTYRLGQRLFCAEVGLLAALIMSSSLMFNVVARAATPDSYLVFFLTLALYLFTLRGRANDQNVAGSAATVDVVPPVNAARVPSWTIWVAMYAVMGVAVLVKGPIGALLPMASIGLYLLCTTAKEPIRGSATWFMRCRRNLRPFGPVNFLRCLGMMKPFTAAAVVLTVAAPWFIRVGQQTHGLFLAEFFGIHNFGRFLQPMESHRGSVLYYPAAILIGFFPWSVFMGATALDLVQRIRSRDVWADGCMLLTCWTAVIVGFFSLASTKLPNYVLPAYPALALLTACLLHRWIYRPQTVPRWQPRAGFGILGTVGLGLLIGLPVAARLEIRGEPLVTVLGAAQEAASELPALGLWGIILLAGAAVALGFAERRIPRVSVVAMTITAVLFTTGILAVAAIRIDRHQYTETLAHVIADAGQGQPLKVGQYRHSRPSLTFYVHRPVETISKAHEATSFFSGHENAFLVTTARSFPDLKASLPPDVVVLAQQAQFPKQGTVLLLGHAPRASRRPTSLTR